MVDRPLPARFEDLRLLKATLAPFADETGKLQAEAAHLEAMQRLGRSPGTSVTQLLNQVNAVNYNFDRAILQLPERLRADSRTRDFRWSVAALKAAVERLEI